MSGGTGGTGRRGGDGGSDEQPDLQGGSWDYVHAPNSIYLWGVGPGSSPGNLTFAQLNIGTAGASGAGSDMLRALPHFFPRAGRLTNIGFFNAGPNAGAGRMRLGIYDNNPATFQPGTLLVDGGDHGPWTDPILTPGDQWRSFNANLDVEALSVLWLAWNYNDTLRADARVVHIVQPSNAIPGILGWHHPEVIPTGDTLYRIPPAGNSFLQGYRHPQAYGAMPGTFPVTASLRPVFTNNSSTEGTAWFNKALCVGFQFEDG